MFREVIESLLWLLFIISICGLIWRLFFVRYPDKGKRGNPQDITNWDVHQLLGREIQEIRGEMRWLISFQTGVLTALLGLILSRI